ncbi:Hydrophobin-1 [Cladosporium halotolerans]|uniref:Hydrophobin-1 n=1 Tax=Cladosporium halotolerans TaxID=1052096 RepID=A0AB34KVF4_9PEZI
MAFIKTLLIASVAALAYAAPQGASDGNTKISASKDSQEAACGNGQKLACCNSGEDLIGANCLNVPILAVPIQQACGSNVAACCKTGDASGNLINLELNCLSLPL